MRSRGLSGRARGAVVPSTAFPNVGASLLAGYPAGGAAPAVRTVLAAGALDAPAALALDEAGDVFVAETGHCRADGTWRSTSRCREPDCARPSPGISASAVREGGVAADRAPGVSVSSVASGVAEIEVGSGTYSFTSS